MVTFSDAPTVKPLLVTEKYPEAHLFIPSFFKLWGGGVFIDTQYTNKGQSYPTLITKVTLRAQRQRLGPAPPRKKVPLLLLLLGNEHITKQQQCRGYGISIMGGGDKV